MTIIDTNLSYFQILISKKSKDRVSVSYDKFNRNTLNFGYSWKPYI